MALETRHALLTREAIAASNYIQFFKLYGSAPRLSRALLDVLLPKIRFTFLKMLAKAFLPALPVAQLATWLGFYCMPDFGDVPSARSASPECPPEGASNTIFPGRYYPKASLLCQLFGVLPLHGWKAITTDSVRVVRQADLDEAIKDCTDWLLGHGAVLVRTPGPIYASAPFLNRLSWLADLRQTCFSAGDLLLDCKRRGNLHEVGPDSLGGQGPRSSLDDFLTST